MQTRDYRDVVSGTALFALGAGVVVHTLMAYPVGTLTSMGPGMFPTALGCVLAVLGLAIGVPAWFRGGSFPEVHVRQLVVVIVSILMFAWLLELVGIVPAVILLTLGVVFADDQVGIRGALVISVGMAVATYLLFGVLLGVPFKAFNWPL